MKTPHNLINSAIKATDKAILQLKAQPTPWTYDSYTDEELKHFAIKEGEGWPLPQSEEFYNLINGLMNQQVEISVNYLKEAEANDIQKADFLMAIEPKMDKIIYTNAKTIGGYVKSFYDLGKTTGFKDMEVKAFTSQVDTNALFRLTQYNFGLVRQLSSDVKESIRTEVWNGVANDLGIKKIAANLETVGIKPLQSGKRTYSMVERAQMIAKTEAPRARNQGLEVSFRQYGVTMWDAVNGPNACPECEELAANGPYPIENPPEGFPPWHTNCEDIIVAAEDPQTKAEDPAQYYDMTLVGDKMVGMVDVNPAVLSAI